MSIFSPDTPDPAPPPPPPGQDPAALAQQDAQALAAAKRLAIGGRASTQLTGDLGDTSTPTTATKRLLGQ
jgi:hypothetical protein